MLVLGQINQYFVLVMVALFFACCVLLILTVLIQKPAGGGLSGAFGSGAGSGQTAFGAKTGDALTIATIFMFSVFVLGAIGLNYVTRPPAGTVVTPTSAAGGSGAAPVAPAKDAGGPASTESDVFADESESAPAPKEPEPEQPAPGDQPQDQPPADPSANPPADQPK